MGSSRSGHENLPTSDRSGRLVSNVGAVGDCCEIKFQIALKTCIEITPIFCVSQIGIRNMRIPTIDGNST